MGALGKAQPGPDGNWAVGDKYVVSKITGEPVNLFSSTWNEAHFYNDYQNAQDSDGATLGNLSLVYKTASDLGDLPYDRRERVFTAALPRNRVITDISDNPDIFDASNVYDTTAVGATEGYMERLRDKYLTIKLLWNNDLNNYKFSCPFVATSYRYSIR